jgi:hypothetical protein
MPSSYTTNLRLVLPVTGELVGTWGDTANVGLTALVDSSIAGTASVAMSDANYTLSVANGLADESRQMFITLTGTLTAERNVICPSNSKLYFVTNNTTGGFSIVFKTSAGTGITVPNGARMVVYCNGTNVLDALTQFNALTVGTLTAPTANVGTLTATSDSAFDSTGAVKLPVGTTAQRPTAAAGKIRFNDDTDTFEGYDGTSWGQLGGGATGGGGDAVFVENGRTVTVSYTLPVSKNAMSAGPITVNSGAVVTIPDGCRWVVI